MKRHKRHHNRDGRTQIRRGSHQKKLQRVARQLGVPFLVGRTTQPEWEGRDSHFPVDGG